MHVKAYYNEIEPYAVQWLKNLIAAKLIPDGDVDDRRIEDVQPGDLDGYTQCHFFAGLGGWGYALRLAGWPDDRPIWTGSAPCQPFSVAGKGAGVNDPRHLWPHLFRLIKAKQPPVVMGEQVAAKAGYGWFDGVGSDLESEDYTCGAVDIPACSVNAPHQRNRLYWVGRLADSFGSGLEVGQEQADERGTVRQQREAFMPDGAGSLRLEHAECPGNEDARRGTPACSSGRMQSQEDERQRFRVDLGQSDYAAGGTTGGLGITNGRGWTPGEQAAEALGHGDSIVAAGRNFWNDWCLIGPDPQGKYRRVKPGVRLLVTGSTARVAKLRALGNAIVPPLAAEVIRAYMEAYDAR